MKANERVSIRPLARNWPNWEAIFFPTNRRLVDRIWVILFIVLVAFGIRILIGKEELGIPFLTFFPAAALSAVFAGFWAGMLATVLGAVLATYFFIPPYGILSFEFRADTVFGNMVYFLDEVFVCAAIDGLYRFYHKAKSQNAELTAVIETIPDLMCLKSPAGIFLDCNPAFERFHGRTRDAIIGKTAASVFAEDIVAADARQCEEAASKRSATITEYWATRATDGQSVLLETISTPMLAPEGGVVGVLSVSRDVTEHRRLQDEVRRRTVDLEKERAFLRAVFEQTGDGIMVVGSSGGRIVLANYRARKILDAGGDPIGTSLLALWPEWRDIAERASAGGEVTWNLDKNDTVLSLSVTAIGKGADTHYVVVVRDVGDELRLADERRVLDQQMFQMEKMITLGELAMGVAHEIGNPLGGMKAVSQSLQHERSLPSEVIEDLKRLESEIDRLSNFLRSFRGFAASQPINLVPCPLLPTVQDLLFWIRKEAGSRGVGVRVDIDPTVEVLADPNRIKQLFLNLFINAIHATPKGGILTVSAALGPGERGQIEIRDTGEGIPPEVLPKIFDPFFTTRAGGTGLGLSIVKKIANEHGAQISVQSEPGRGTCFKLEWPIAHREREG